MDINVLSGGIESMEPLDQHSCPVHSISYPVHFIVGGINIYLSQIALSIILDYYRPLPVENKSIVMDYTDGYRAGFIDGYREANK